jgi:hypothetical protein
MTISLSMTGQHYSSKRLSHNAGGQENRNHSHGDAAQSKQDLQKSLARSYGTSNLFLNPKVTASTKRRDSPKETLARSLAREWLQCFAPTNAETALQPCQRNAGEVTSAGKSRFAA